MESIKHLIRGALSTVIDDRALLVKGIDISDFYEDYSEYKTETV